MFAKRCLVAVAAMGVAVGCSSSGTSPSKAVTKAVAATIGAGSVRESVTAVSPTASGTSTTKATGAYSFANHQGSFQVDTGQLLGTVESLLDKSTLYVRLPAAIVGEVGGKPWLSVDLNNPPNFPGVGNLGNLAAGADPSKMLATVQGGLTGTTKVGTETIGGQQTTHYKGTIDLQKAENAASGTDKQNIAAEIKLLGTSTSQLDAWVRSDGRLQRVVTTVNLANSKVPGAKAGVETVTVDFSDYGAPVNVAVPPAGQVTDAGKLLGQ